MLSATPQKNRGFVGIDIRPRGLFKGGQLLK
jgi:hypothetical protein